VGDGQELAAADEVVVKDVFVDDVDRQLGRALIEAQQAAVVPLGRAAVAHLGALAGPQVAILSE